MKKLLTILMTLVVMTSFVGCTHTDSVVESPTEATTEPTTEVVEVNPVHTRYVTTGRYYTIGEVITDDGHIWGYTQDVISEKPSYDNEPVYAVFDDNGTPDEITDDIIVGLVFDIETAIYDDLEVALSESFELEREDNNIHITAQKEVD